MIQSYPFFPNFIQSYFDWISNHTMKGCKGRPSTDPGSWRLMTVGYLNHSRMSLLERWICAGMRQTCCGPWQPSICLAQFLYIFWYSWLGKDRCFSYACFRRSCHPVVACSVSSVITVRYHARWYTGMWHHITSSSAEAAREAVLTPQHCAIRQLSPCGDLRTRQQLESLHPSKRSMRCSWWRRRHLRLRT
jgi:hypothetical protein